jgi:hypothetical protein
MKTAPVNSGQLLSCQDLLLPFIIYTCTSRSEPACCGYPDCDAKHGTLITCGTAKELFTVAAPSSVTVGVSDGGWQMHTNPYLSRTSACVEVTNIVIEATTGEVVFMAFIVQNQCLRILLKTILSKRTSLRPVAAVGTKFYAVLVRLVKTMTATAKAMK